MNKFEIISTICICILIGIAIFYLTEFIKYVIDEYKKVNKGLK
jgi:hypothetical protein